MDRNVRKPRSRRGTVAVAIASTVAILVAVVVILFASAPQRPKGPIGLVLPPGVVLMPNVVGLSLNEANASLRKAGLAIESKYLRARASGAGRTRHCSRATSRPRGGGPAGDGSAPHRVGGTTQRSGLSDPGCFQALKAMPTLASYRVCRAAWLVGVSVRESSSSRLSHRSTQVTRVCPP
jgi:hypothetical protein